VGGIVRAVKAVIAWAKALLLTVRSKRPIIDHLFQAAGRYSQDQGGRLTSVITLPGFLSFFPLLGLALSVAGFVAHYDAGAQQQITKAINGYFPGFDVQSLVTSITAHRTSTGIISLVGLLFSGLGLITTLRGALRSLFHLPQSAGNFFVAKGKDLLTLVTLGFALLVSFGLTAVATSATTVVADHLSFLSGTFAQVLLRIVTFLIAVGGDVLLFGTAYVLLPQTESRLRDTLDGALFGAIGFEILKSVGAIYLQRTTSNPLYGTFAVAIGLLVWTKIVAQLFVFAAAWAVTAPYDPDTPPSATALEPDGVAAVAMPTGPALSRRQHAAAAGAGTAAFGALAGLAVVIGARALRTALPKRSR
jgi:membrane protein